MLAPSRWARLTALYPTGWVDEGAPILVRRGFRREAHAPPHRYELRIEAPCPVSVVVALSPGSELLGEKKRGPCSVRLRRSTLHIQ
ncbi:DUF6349 family protein [Streptomyces sp. NPDC050842]|uniref:DUF6349 family protein n=1 Tax=Streptomyces sp. NPDC050842 TaxID=3365636 RepID=UPI003793AB81